jgi:NAD(P)-dependent dehydrogenase (short-subunit alcohol dehydrogenase family)
MSLSGHIGLVTGAARGIGEGVARCLAGQGATVVCLDVNDAGQVAKTIVEQGGRAEAALLDVASGSEWAAVVDDVAARHGRIDFLVNVAGIPVMDPDVTDSVETLTDEWWSRVIDVNLKGTWLGMRAVMPHLRAAGGGRIVNTSSLAAARAIPGLAAYSASKGGIESLTRQAAAEYAADKILINAVAPGTIATPLLLEQTEEIQRANAAGHLIQRLGDTAEVGSLVAYLLDGGSFITGAVIPVDGGWSVRARYS